MIILAHRGLWQSATEKNSLAALREALQQGFGVETDLRDRNGRIVISHDPPTADAPTLDQFLDIYVESQSRQLLALNVKSDGLHQSIKDALTKRDIAASQYFMFDMAVPDALGYLQHEMPCFTRESELEPSPAFLDDAAGVWLDCFHRDWINKDTIVKHCDAGRRVALVSPELHRRDRSSAWETWRLIYRALKADGRQDMMMICTDYPREARDFFRGED